MRPCGFSVESSRGSPLMRSYYTLSDYRHETVEIVRAPRSASDRSRARGAWTGY